MRIEAIYEDGVLRLRAPLPLPEHTPVQVEVTPAEPNATERLPMLPRDVWEQALGAVSLGGDALADSEAYYDAP